MIRDSGTRLDLREPYQRLEVEFGRWARVSNVVGCSSGTAALHLALEALRLPPGSEVIVPTYTMIACARAVTLAGLVPVFVDCGDDLLLDPALLARALSHETRAIMAVHVYGRRCDMDAIAELAGTAGLAVVEDLAEAHGVAPHPATDAACWSFFRNKIVAGEEGGAVAFRDAHHAHLARQLRCLGFTDAHDYQHTPRGHNYRLSNAHARLVLESLAVADANVFRRRQVEAAYERWCPREWRMPGRDAVWVYDVRVPGMTRPQQDSAVAALKSAGVQARHGFKPMSEQEEYRECRKIGGENAAQLSREVLYLPVVPGSTTEAMARHAFSVLRDSLADTEEPSVRL